MASKNTFSSKDALGDEELDELLNDPEKLVAVLDKSHQLHGNRNSDRVDKKKQRH